MINNKCGPCDSSLYPLQSDQTGRVEAPEEAPIEGTTPPESTWFFQRWRKRKQTTILPPIEAASSPASSTSLSSFSSRASSSSSSPTPLRQSVEDGLREKLYSWYTWFYSEPQGSVSNSSGSLPFDEGQILKEIVTVDTLSKTIFVSDMSIIMRSTDIGADPYTMMIGKQLVRSSKQFVSDIPRMLRSRQLLIKGRQIVDTPDLDDQKKAEVVMQRIYKLTGGNEEMTYQITCLMCQNIPLFLYHSASNQLYKQHHILVMQGEQDETTKESYNLTRSVGRTPAERNINLKVTTVGSFGMGMIEREGYAPQMIKQPAIINAKEEINLTAGTAQYTYKTTLTPEAVAQLQLEELERIQFVLHMCMENIRKSLNTEDLFCVSGSITQLNAFSEAFKDGKTLEALEKIFNATMPRDSLFAADLMKRILREIPIIPYERRNVFLSLAEELRNASEDGNEKMVLRLKSLISDLPQFNQNLLKEIFTFFEEVSAGAEINHMTRQAISNMFSTILFPSPDVEIDEFKLEREILSQLIEFLIVNRQIILVSIPQSEQEFT